MAAPTLQQEIRKAQAFDLPQEEAYLNLRRTLSVLERPFNDLFKHHGLSEATYNVLRILRGHGKRGVHAHSIGPMMVSRLPDVTRLVDRLVSRGLAERERSEEDRRVVTVRITREGSALLRRLDRPTADLHRRQFAALSDAELTRLNRLLEKARP